MNKDIFLKVFNNQLIFKLIFNYIHKFKISKPKTTFYSPHKKPKNYKWKDLIETPHVLIEYGYLDQLREYYNKYYKSGSKYHLSFEHYEDLGVKLFEIAIKYNRKDVFNFFFNELKIQYDRHHLYTVINKTIDAGQWDLLDYFLMILPQCTKWFSEYLLKCAPYSGSLDRLKHASAMVQSMTIKKSSLSVFESAASVGRVDMIDWLLKNRDKKEIKNHQMYDFATKGGHINVIQYLIENNIESTNHLHSSRSLIDEAVKANQLETLKYICKNHEKFSNSAYIDLLDFASKSDIEMLDWLHENRTEHCTDELLVDGARKGRLDIIQWAHSNRPLQFSTRVMDIAALNGFIDIVIWLHENRTEGCTSDAMDFAAEDGHLEIVKWLHENRTEGCTTKAMNFAAENGHLNVIIWLHENRTEGCTTRAIDRAVSKNKLKVVKWLHENRTEVPSNLCLSVSDGKVNLKIMKWLHEHNMGHYISMIKGTALCGMLQNNHFEAFKWIHENCGQFNLNKIPTRALHIVSRKIVNQNNLDFYQWLLNFFSIEDLKTHRRFNLWHPKTMFSDILDQKISEMDNKKCIIN